MGGGKGKKFIDKRAAAHFHLMPCPSSTGDDSSRVFVRVDSNPYPSVEGFGEEANYHGEDFGDKDNSVVSPDTNSSCIAKHGRRSTLPEHVRKEILELGFPDDGYNYLLHLREIRPLGAGAAYYANPSAQLLRLPDDIKAYDATKVRIGVDNLVEEDEEDDSKMAAMALEARPVRVQKVVDQDVAKLLDDSDDGSKVASDDETLEEDFVLKANVPPDGDDNDYDDDCYTIYKKDKGMFEDEKSSHHENIGVRQPARSQLDELFDMVMARDYNDSKDDEDIYGDAVDDYDLSEKLKHALKEFHGDNLELEERYGVPADLRDEKQGSREQLELCADVRNKCAEYVEKYLNGDDEVEDTVLDEESSGESEFWDCQTIVSTYSNTDNHPGKIQAPETGKKRLPKVFPGEDAASTDIIRLQGRQMLPLQYLSGRRKEVSEKENKEKASDREKLIRLPEETKEEKKKRKAAVKEAKKEARIAKKEMKGLYRNETRKAQQMVAVSAPCSVHRI